MATACLRHRACRGSGAAECLTMPASARRRNRLCRRSCTAAPATCSTRGQRSARSRSQSAGRSAISVGGKLEDRRAPGPYLLIDPLDPELDTADFNRRKFRAQRSLRDVEPSAPLLIESAGPDRRRR